MKKAKRKSPSPRSASAIDKNIGVPYARAKARSRNESAHVNFDAVAVLRKWPSLHNERRTEGTGPYLIVDGTLDECIREFMAKPTSLRHLYEIHTRGCESFSDPEIVRRWRAGTSIRFEHWALEPLATG